MEEEENKKEGAEEAVNIAEAAEAGTPEQDEDVKISLTVFEDEDLEDLPSDEEEEKKEEEKKEEGGEKENAAQETTQEPETKAATEPS